METLPSSSLHPAHLPWANGKKGEELPHLHLSALVNTPPHPWDCGAGMLLCILPSHALCSVNTANLAFAVAGCASALSQGCALTDSPLLQEPPRASVGEVLEARMLCKWIAIFVQSLVLCSARLKIPAHKAEERASPCPCSRHPLPAGGTWFCVHCEEQGFSFITCLLLLLLRRLRHPLSPQSSTPDSTRTSTIRICEQKIRLP